jgi:hypothetical protein
MLRQSSGVPASVLICYPHSMLAKLDMKRLAASVRAAERELDAAKGSSSLNGAIRRVMRA